MPGKMAVVLLLAGLAAGLLAGIALKPAGAPTAQVEQLRSQLAAAQGDAGLWRGLQSVFTATPPLSMADHSIHNPAHNIGPGTVLFFHFDTPEKKSLLFAGTGVAGNGCRSTQERVNAVNGGGYTHFHALKGADGKGADVHGIPPGARGDQVEGFWFRHVAVRDVGTGHPMAAMFLGPSQKPLKAGEVASDFFPTPPDAGC